MVPIYTDLTPGEVITILTGLGKARATTTHFTKKEHSMNKILSILAAIENVEASVLAAKIPIVSTGIGGTILGVSLLAEEEVSALLQAIQMAKTPPAPPVPVVGS